MHGLEVDEMDFGSIGKTLSKYGKGVPADAPKTPKRSSVHGDYTMTGHKEGKSSTGRVYTKAPEMDREPEAIKATAKTDQVEAPKRGRGRPVGATNKAGTGKGWSAEAKASMKAKLAARKAAKLAAKNESEELDESLVGRETKDGVWRVFKSGNPVAVAGPFKSAEEARQYIQSHKNESTELTEEDWADIVEGQSLDSIVEFMMDEEFQSLDELSKATLGSYIKKASRDQASAASSQQAHKMLDQKEFADAAGATRKKRRIGIDKATDRLTKESVELEEAIEISHDRFERSHGTKARDKGPARWMFTSKRFGNVNHKDETEFHEAPHGSFAAAKKSAASWAKKHGHTTAYVMESVEVPKQKEHSIVELYASKLTKNLIVD